VWVPAARPSRPPFDPATGGWIPVGQPVAPLVPPEATRKGTVQFVLLSILLWIDLALLGLGVLIAIISGAILLLAPDSAAADDVRELLEGGGKESLILNTVFTFVLFGVIPFFWVLGTRMRPVEGTKRFLHLHEPAKGVLQGIGLAILLLVGVAILIVSYTLATEGPEGLTDEGQDPNPAVQDILDNLSWPIAVMVALCAGVGEEIFFRGFLQRYLGPWWQGVLFGLAHATGGYVPQVIFALGMGIAFGHLVKRGWSLWALITAHVLYDFTLLALALVAPEIG
jgi:membrane protease YdiL (CAAX protease family)